MNDEETKPLDLTAEEELLRPYCTFTPRVDFKQEGIVPLYFRAEKST